MKSVVTEINGSKAILLQADGTFIQVTNQNYDVGQEITLKLGGLVMKKISKIAIAVAAVLVVLSGGFAYASTVPQSYVSVDINPSIELSINWFNKVIKASGMNEDGTTVLSEIELKNMEVEQAVGAIVIQAATDGYINSKDANTVLVTVYNNNYDRAEAIKVQAQEQATQALEASGANAQVITKTVNREDVENASEKGMTAGKLGLIEKYIEENGGIEIDDLKGESIQDIIDEIDDAIDDYFDDYDDEEDEDDLDDEDDSDEDDEDDKDDDEDDEDDEDDVDKDDEDDDEENENNEDDVDKDDEEDDEEDEDNEDDKDDEDDDEEDEDNEDDEDEDNDNDKDDEDNEEGDDD